MNIGGLPAGAKRKNDTPDADVFAQTGYADAWSVLDDNAVENSVEEEDLVEEPSLGERWPAFLLIGVAILWMGAALWLMAGTGGLPPRFLEISAMLALATAPVSLLAIALMLLGPTSRRRARDLMQAASRMRAEAEGLQMVMTDVSAQIASNAATLSDHVTTLHERGQATSQAIAETNQSLRDNITTLERQSLLLGAAATSAREEMKTLLTDMPDAESRMNALTDLLRSAGRIVDNQAAGLQAQLLSLSQRAREADQSAATATGSLVSQLERMETTLGAAAGGMDEMGNRLSASLDGLVERAREAADETRRSIDAQGASMLAMIEQNRASFDRAGADASQAIARRIAAVDELVSGISERLALQQAASTTLLDQLQQAVNATETRLAALKDSSAEKTAELTRALAGLTDEAGRVGAGIDDNARAATALNAQLADVREALETCARALETDLPQHLARVHEQAEGSRALIETVLPATLRLQEAAEDASSHVEALGGSLGAHEETLASIGRSATRQVTHIREEAEELARLIEATEARIATISEAADSSLSSAVTHLHEVASKASMRARAALESIVPDAARALSDASAKALSSAVSGPLRDELASISEAGDAAVASARASIERLQSELATLRETSDAIDARIEQVRAENAMAEENSFAHRVSLLIEALNSSAIDVTKILSNEATDSAWAAYLRGDRSVFTRRAVKLLDSGTSREIARKYDEDPEFREQVNRYVHDFEALIRRVLANRDASPLSVTMLSSDVGKLYVALAQAIERLRN